MQGVHGRLASIMFASVAPCPGVDAAQACRLDTLRRPIERVIRQHGGRLIDLHGHELFACFRGAQAAFGAALALRRLARLGGGVCDLGIGLHLGEVQSRDGQVYGQAVNVAARIRDLAAPGSICLSAEVRQYLREPGDVVFEDLGLRSLRYIDGRFRVFAVARRRRGLSPVVWSRHRAAVLAARLRATLPGFVGFLLLLTLASGLVKMSPPGAWPLSLLAPDHVIVTEFRNLNPAVVPGHVVDGIEDAVRTGLATLPGLVLLAAGDARPAEMRLEASIQQNGSRLRASYRLVSLSSGDEMSGGVIEHDRAELFRLQDRLADSVAIDLARTLELDHGPAPRDPVLTDNPALAYYHQGEDYLDRSWSEAALGYAHDLFTASVKADPRFARAYAGLCRVDLERYRHRLEAVLLAQAELSCGRAFRLDSTAPVVMLAQAALDAVRGRYDVAVTAYRSVLALHPRDGTAHRGLARIHLTMNQYGRALASLNNAMESQTGYWRNYQAMGELLLQQGQAGAAIEWLQRAIALTPDNADAYRAVGLARLQQADYAAAQVALQQSLLLQPSALTHNAMGLLYNQLGQFGQAHVLQQQAVDAAPGNPRFWVDLGDARRQIYGHDDGTLEIYLEAVQRAREILVVNTDNPAAWLALAAAYAQLRERDQSINALRQGLALAGENLELNYRGALVWSELGEIPNALALSQRVVSAGWAVEFLRDSPDLATLRGQSPFREPTGGSGLLSARHAD